MFRPLQEECVGEWMSHGAAPSYCSCNQPTFSNIHHHHCEHYTRRAPPRTVYNYREPAINIMREPARQDEAAHYSDYISLHRYPTTESIYLQPNHQTARPGSPGHRLYNLQLPFENEDRLGELRVSTPYTPYSHVYCAHCDRAMRRDGSCGCDLLSLYSSPPSSPLPTLMPRSYHSSYLPHDIASSLYPTLDEWMGMDSKALQVYQPSSSTGVIAPITGAHQTAVAEIKQGVRQVVGCKDPGSGKIGLSVESISKGVFVSYVESGSIAAKAGLRFGDQIVQINGETVAGWSKKKTIEFLKKADPSQIRFAVRDRPFERTITCVKDSTGHVGFQFKKAKINAIVKDSSAARNGMLTDHFITEIDGQNVVGLSDDKILKIIQSKDRVVTVTVMPDFVYDHMVKHLGSSLKKHMDHSAPTEL